MKQLLFHEPFDVHLITQPNQAFTPRQILEQFARGEVVPSEFRPSDNIDESNTSEESLINDVIEFEDKIDAENHLIENQYELYKEEQQEGATSSASLKEASGETQQASGD